MNINEYDLILLDVDGTLVERGTSQFLEGVLAWRRDNPDQPIAFVTNQGGVACRDAGWGDHYPSLDEVYKLYGEIAHHLDGRLYISLAYKTSGGEWIYPTGPVVDERSLLWQWRKPNPAMLVTAMMEHNVPAHRTLMVGDRDEDREAASRANVRFIWAHEFFNRPDPSGSLQ